LVINDVSRYQSEPRGVFTIELLILLLSVIQQAEAWERNVFHDCIFDHVAWHSHAKGFDRCVQPLSAPAAHDRFAPFQKKLTDRILLN
jgi:hypothetical protein